MVIGIPVLLFYFQQKAERDKQMSLLQIETYSNISILLHELVENRSLSKNDFEHKRIQTFHEYVPRVALYSSDDSLNYLFARINYSLKFYSQCKRVLYHADSLNEEMTSIFRVNYVDLSNFMDLWNSSGAFSAGINDLDDRRRGLESGIPGKQSGPVFIHETNALYNSLEKIDSALRVALHKLVNLRNTKKNYARNTKKTYLKLDADMRALEDQVWDVDDFSDESHVLLEEYLMHVNGLIEKLDRIFVKTNRYLSDE